MLKFVSFSLFSYLLASQAVAQEWTFKPEIYARGGATYKSDFSREAGEGNYRAFNNGPFLEESIVDYPLTELTLHVSYGDQFVYHVGVDVNDSRRFLSQNDGENRRPVMERVNYLEFKATPSVSLWYGNRPYRSPPEYLSRAFLFDEKNILGGGVRFENVGPTNIEFAYGSFDLNRTDDTTQVRQQDHTNVFINKFELPMANGAIKTNFELQQTKRSFSDQQNQGGTHGYLAGVSYQRWGDQVLGGGLYNQLMVHLSQGNVQRTAMQSAFNQFDRDLAASKTLVAWNGDWKRERAALYWLGLYQDHKGQSDTVSDSSLVWQTLDAMVRPVYALTEQVNVGIEWSRRSVLKEGEGLRTGAVNGTNNWAVDNGSTRLGGLVHYTLKGRNFSTPTIGIFAGEVRKDKANQFFYSEAPKKTARFVHFFYEININ